MTEAFGHVPVLASEALHWLGPVLGPEDVLVDCTLGGGGHSEAFLERFAHLRIVALDRDDEALSAAKARLERFGDRVSFWKSNFAGIDEVLKEQGHGEVAAIFYDLGVSSPQLDRPGRGFGYRAGFALDMRMDRDSGLKAADIVNSYSIDELTNIIARYGEERFARRIARAVVERRERQAFEDAGDLAEVVKAAIPAATRRTGPHPARRTFQALRIETNAELESLEQALESSIELLRVGGRIAVISYHSLEDRIVKHAFRDAAQGCICPKDVPVCVCNRKPKLKVLTGKPVRPSAEEIAANPRSDSARMRVAEKLEAA